MREADKKERTGKRKSRPRKVLRTKRRTKAHCFLFLKRQIITGGLLGGDTWQLGNM